MGTFHTEGSGGWGVGGADQEKKKRKLNGTPSLPSTRMARICCPKCPKLLSAPIAEKKSSGSAFGK